MKLLTQGLVCFATMGFLLSCATHHDLTTTQQDMLPAKVTQASELLFVSNQDGDREIYVAGFDAEQPARQLTFNDNDDYDASWSPDGQQIVFTSNRIRGNTEVFVMNADGSNQQNISRHAGFDGRPQWSPDGSMIAFNSDRNGVEQIYLWHKTSGDISLLTEHEHAAVGHQWSPDGKWLAYQYLGPAVKPDIWITSVDGNETRILTTNSKSEDGAINWSPDGSKIAYQSRRNYRYNIYVYDLATSQETQLTHLDSIDVSPSWSASGESLAFLSARGQYSRTQLCVMKEDGTEQRCFTDSRYQTADPIWLSDKRILHSNWNGARFSNVYVLDIASGQLSAVAPAKGYQSQPLPRPAVLPTNSSLASRQQVSNNSDFRRNL